MRIKYLCVLDDKVYEIPISKMKNGNMVRPELSGKTVLMMEMIYDTENRKPFKFIRINFDRVTFDENGIYDVQAASTSGELSIKLSYIFADIDPDGQEPLPIPIAPIIPSQREIEVLKKYIHNKYPSLLLNSPDAIEDTISRSIEIHKKNIERMKKSHKSSC